MKRNGLRCKVAGVRSCALILALVSALALADKSSRTNSLESIYEFAGVHAHLAWVHSTVTEEAQLAWQSCKKDQVSAEIKAILEQSLSVDTLRQGFLAELDERIDDKQLAQIIDWTNSIAGKKVHQAEIDSINIDESNFNVLLDEYKKSPVHGEARNTKLKHMLADTGAVYFLSALHTELSALVSVASVCSTAAEELAAAQKQVREDRGEEALYRSFMRQELIVPSAVIYQNITDSELEALSAFAKSDAGNAYYSALIKGTRGLLSGKVDRLSEALETSR